MESIVEKLAREWGRRKGTELAPQMISTAEVEGDWRDWRWWINRLYRVGCFGLGIVLTELSLLELGLSNLKAAFLFMLLNFGAALYAVTFPKYRRISFHFILTYSNLLLFGPGVAALASGAGAFGHHLIFRQKSLSTAMFQMGRFMLAAMGAGFIFSVLGGRWGVANLTWSSVILSAMAYLAINFLLEALPLFWSHTRSLRALWSSFVWNPLAYIVFVPTSVCIFYIYFPYGPDGVLLFLIPVATFILALELYARSAIARQNLTIVQEISRRFSSFLDPDRLIGEALELTGRVIDFLWAVVWLKNSPTGELEPRYSLSRTGQHRAVSAEIPEAVVRAVRTGESVVSPLSFPPVVNAFDESTSLSLLAVPLSSGGQVLGALSLATITPGGYTAQERLLLETLAGNVAIAVQNARLYKQREKEAIRDELTRIYNRRFLREKLTQEEARSKRYGRIFSLIIIDIDHFKVYNDAFGHPAGDQLLIALSKILMESVREVDFVARYGGEEFAIVLPECNKEKAVVVAERLRKKVEDFSNPNRDHYNLTVSAGIASFPTDGNEKEEILDKADQALYRAKREGRNKVCWWET